MDRLISEKQVINAIKTWAIPLQVSNSETIEDLWVNGVCELIKAIPSEEPKTGHWITKIKSDLRGDMWPTNPKCSKCGGEPYYSNTIYDYKFCPYCGARMVEPQESEDKE